MRKLTKPMSILVFILLVFILVLSVSLYAGEQSHQPVDTLAQQVMKLKKRLNLTDVQITKVDKILKRAGEQAVKDRETFKTDAVTLVEVAWERRETANIRIEALLTPDQREEFQKIARMTPFDRELFDLTEGLLLNDDQAFTVEGILIKYYNTLNEMIPEEMKERIAEGDRESDVKRGRLTGMGMGMLRYGRLKRVMEEFNEKKVRAIKKILFKEQKILYKQLRKHRKKRMEEWMKRRKGVAPPTHSRSA
jgi:Spy/CpxP family protein refolding chaperone